MGILEMLLLLTYFMISVSSGSSSSTVLCGNYLTAFYKVVEEANASLEGTCCNAGSSSRSGQFTCSSAKTCINQCGRNGSNCAKIVFYGDKQRRKLSKARTDYCSGNQVNLVLKVVGSWFDRFCQKVTKNGSNCNALYTFSILKICCFSSYTFNSCKCDCAKCIGLGGALDSTNCERHESGLEKSRLFFKKTGPVAFFGFYWLFLKKAGFYYHHFFKDFTTIFSIL